MRFALVGPVYPFRGGIAHHTAMLAQALQTRDHATNVFSFRRQYPTWLYPGTSDLDPSAQPLQVKASYTLDPLYPWTWQANVQSMKRDKPDQLVVQWWTTFWAPAFAYLASQIRRSGIFRTFIIHNVLPHEPKPWDRWLARLALAQGDGFITQSDRETERLRGLLPHAKIFRCQFPIYEELAHHQIPQKEAREKLGIPNDIPTLLFFGLVRPYKGLKVLIDALARLNNQDQHVFLIVAGEFWESLAEYQEQITRLGIDARVWIDNRYIPNEELPAYFSAADVFVAPYIQGTQSASVTTALAFGMPIVISQSIVDSAIGLGIKNQIFPFSTGDPHALVQAIQHAIDHPQKGKNHLLEIDTGWGDFVDALETLPTGNPGIQHG